MSQYDAGYINLRDKPKMLFPSPNFHCLDEPMLCKVGGKLYKYASAPLFTRLSVYP